MGILAKLIRRPAGGQPRVRSGAAIATALFALTAAALLTAGVHFMTRADIRTTTNRESAVRAMVIAEAGASHALGIMRELSNQKYGDFIRGPDTSSYNTADDGILSGWTLTSGENDIPAAGRAFAGGRYTVRVTDDPADRDGDVTRDSNNRVIVRCTGFGPDGAKAEVDVLVGGTPMPALIIDGPVRVSGDEKVMGSCGTVHANGKIDGTITACGPVSTTEPTAPYYAFDCVTRAKVPILTGQPRIEPPRLDAVALCATARYRMEEDGDVWDQSLGLKLGNAKDGLLGWKWAPGAQIKWELDAAISPDGSYCFEGNVIIGKEVGTPLIPVRWSIYATGSVSVSGNPYMVSFDTDSIVIASNGDVMVGGNPAVGALSYGGTIYAKHQCVISGEPTMRGQFICDNDSPQAPDAMEMVTENVISGNPTITYNCGGSSSSSRKFQGWMQVQGPQ